MKIIVLFITLFLVAASAQDFFRIINHEGNAITLGNRGNHAYLKLTPVNEYDAYQHWELVPASPNSGYYIVSRAYPTLVFDITGGVRQGAQVAGWEKLGGENQRFNFNLDTGLFTPVGAANLQLGIDSTGKVVLVARHAGDTGLQTPGANARYTIRIMGIGRKFTVSFPNVPALPSISLSASNAYYDVNVIAGTIIKAIDSNGVLSPYPYEVIMPDTVTFSTPTKYVKVSLTRNDNCSGDALMWAHIRVNTCVKDHAAGATAKFAILSPTKTIIYKYSSAQDCLDNKNPVSSLIYTTTQCWPSIHFFGDLPGRFTITDYYGLYGLDTNTQYPFQRNWATDECNGDPAEVVIYNPGQCVWNARLQCYSNPELGLINKMVYDNDMCAGEGTDASLAINQQQCQAVDTFPTYIGPYTYGCYYGGDYI